MASIDSPTSLVSNTAMIVEVQKTLSLLDYGPIPPSGEFDAATGDAIQKFKVDHDILPADRTLDRKTYEAILSAYKFGKYKTALKYVGGCAALLGLGLLAKKALSRSKAEQDGVCAPLPGRGAKVFEYTSWNDEEIPITSPMSYYGSMREFPRERASAMDRAYMEAVERVQATGVPEKAKVMTSDGATTVRIYPRDDTGYLPIKDKVAAGPYRDNRDYAAIPEIALPLKRQFDSKARGPEAREIGLRTWDSINQYRATPDIRRFGKASTG